MANIIGYTAGARNVVPNPSFEVDTAGYTLSQSTGIAGSWARTNEWSYAGSWSICYTVSTTSIVGGAAFAQLTSNLPVIPGNDFSMKVRTLVTDDRIQPFIRITWYTAALAFISNSNEDITSSTANVMRTHSVSYTVPPTAAFAQVFLRFRSSVNGLSGIKCYCDGWDIRNSSVVDSYIDGSMGPDFAWTGTPHNSPSDRAAKPLYGPSGRDGLILMEPALFKADKLNNIGEDISYSILSGNVEMRSDREVKMQFKGTTVGVNPINAYTDYIAPFLKLSYPDGTEVFEQIGLYSIAPQGQEWEESYVTGSFQAYDLTWNLQDSSFGVPFTVAAGTNVVQSMRNILNNEGLTRWSIPDNSATFTTARTWNTDKSKLAILNDHAEMIGYYTLHATRTGIITSYPYNDLDNIEPAITLFSGEGSTVIDSIKKDKLIDGIINMVRVTKEGAADATITYTQTNSNPLSPVSTTALGRIKFREIKMQDLASLAVAKDIARKTLRDAASVYTKYQIKTLPDPSRNVWESYDTLIYMSDGTEVISGNVRCTGWDIGFTPNEASMVHYCSRYEPFE